MESYENSRSQGHRPSAYIPHEILTEFDENYRTLVENAPDIFFIIDLKGKFLLVNKAIRRITGHSPSSILGTDLRDIVAPEETETVTRILSEAPEGFTHPYFETEFVSTNGLHIPLEIHIKTVRDKRGRIAALRGIARDITERKKIDAAYQASEKKFLELTSRAKDGVVIIQDGICRFANAASTEILGYRFEEFQGKRFYEWFPSKDKETLQERYKKRMAGEDGPSQIETKILHKDGSIKTIVYSTSLIQHEGQPAEMGILQDVSHVTKIEAALKKSEEKYQILVENINEIIFMMDPGGRFTFISPAVTERLGYTPEEVLGKSFQDFVIPEDAPVLETYLHQVLEGDKKPFDVRVRDKENMIRHIRISWSAMMDGGEPVGILGISTDVTERKATLEKLNQAYKDVENTKAQLKAIIDNAPNVAIQGFDRDGRVIFWNRYAEKLLGISEDEIKGKTLKGTLMSEKEEERFRKILEETLRTNKPSPLVELKLNKNSGGEKHVLASVFPIILPGQEPIAVSMDMDITDRKKAEEKIREMSLQIERFSKISAAILSIENEELFEHIAQAVVDISDFSRVLISYFIDMPPYREILAHRGVKKHDLDRVKKVEMPREKFMSYFEKGIKIGAQSCYIPHYLKDILDQNALIPGERTYPEKENAWHKEDNLLVCMKDTKGEVIGMISVDDSKSGLMPTEETVRPLEIFANMISEIIQRRMLARKIKESEEKFRELVTNIQIGVFRATPEGKILEANPAVVEMFGYPDPRTFCQLETSELYQNPNDNGFFIKEIEQNGIVQNRDILMRKENNKTFWASVTATAVRNELGKVAFYDAVVEDITERKKLQEEVKRLSVTDELTGLYNRRYFNQKLPLVLKATETFRSALSLIMVDIDDFKVYNDTYHHLEGDEVLKEIARVIHQNIRTYKEDDWELKFGGDEFAFNDWAARFGGDEFVIVLPGQNAEDATLVAERIRNLFQEVTFTPRDKSLHKTVSLGVASCHYAGEKSKKGTKKKPRPPDYEKAATELTNLADRALFEAKKSGKNRTVKAKTSLELVRPVA